MNHQRGVALFTALLIVFLATVAAVALASLQQFAIRRSTILEHQQQARLYALGAEQFAVQVLKRDREDSETDHLNEDWAAPLAVPIDGGELVGTVKDMQGCFNLNTLLKTEQADAGNTAAEAAAEPGADADNLIRPDDSDASFPEETGAEELTDAAETAADDAEDTAKDADEDPDEPIDKAQLQALLRQLEDLELNSDLAYAIADWIDPDQETRFPGGAEDGIYVGLDPAYRTANRPLISVSELRLIQGFNAEPDTRAGIDSDEEDPYTRLAPYVCALPPGTKLNVNTASAAELSALEGIDEAQAEIIVDYRQSLEDGFENLDAFCQQWPGGGTECPRAELALASDYFMIRVEASVGEAVFVLNSLLHRTDNDNTTRIIMRRFNDDR